MEANVSAERRNGVGSQSGTCAGRAHQPHRQAASEKKPSLAVCAMDKKAQSKPMRNLLSRLGKDYDVHVFGDRVILDDDVNDWPVCDLLIAFFSSGFPLHKAVEYVNLRQPYSVNDLELQEVLLDRRCVLTILDAIGVPTPRRLVVHRGVPPAVSGAVVDRVRTQLGCDLLRGPFVDSEVYQPDEDTLIANGQKLSKNFVEKPCDSECHDINIYFAKSNGGGVRRLFRKVANESSRYDPETPTIRDDGPYIYEELMDVDNAEDVKVYTIGPEYAYAETRKYVGTFTTSASS
ncbi:MAG: hypothetical protein BJ554DRAFT_7488 [Olpidium bornovanus]|uniref:VIP1 N-terminal domain-containing protein n=1 Tax=Olpidium bornovanus TaxID=278681 RepID=A0A8H8DJU2_9FUNG|nr:MAG: hypothetical protein BJ554DRAFT_7488 [Olpidium bornovanus]